MNWYRNLKISLKLIIGFLIVAVLAGTIGIVGLISLDSIGDNAQYLYEYATEPIRQVSRALSLFEENRVETRNLLFIESDKELRETIDGIRARVDEIESIMDEYQKTIKTETGRAYYEDFASAYEDYLPILNQIVDLIESGNKEAATSILFDDAMKDAAGRTQEGLQGLISTRAKNGGLEYEKILNTSKKTKITMISLSVVGVAIAISLNQLVNLSLRMAIKATI